MISSRDMILVGVGVIAIVMVVAKSEPPAVEFKLVDTQHQQIVDRIQQQAGNL